MKLVPFCSFRVLVGEGLFVKEVNSVNIEPLMCNYFQVQ